MFVQQSKYDDVVRQLAEQNAEVARLNAQLSGLTLDQSAIDALNSEKDLLTQQVNTLGAANASFETQIAAFEAQVVELNQQVTDLTAENETLRALPGATSALAITETENANGAAITDLDKLNEFVTKNSEDVNACLDAINKYTNQLK